MHLKKLKLLHSLMQKLAHDLRLTILPSYDDILDQLNNLLTKRISIEALTALLATFSALFKYNVVASGDETLLHKTWDRVRDSLKSCNSDVQRAMAEVWGTLLRRLKVVSRELLIRHIIEDLAKIEDTCAWMLVFACKVR
jgi:U3 small nucleolar RNA-associated protein 20